MNDDQRAAIRANANYLREVRPIDPEEIDEYVTGQPHPAVVREVLRESAAELDLIERDDGTFVPVAAEPITTDFSGVAALPEPHVRALEDLLVDEYGAGWPTGESGERLRERIRTFKESYFAGESVNYDRGTALAYAIYHLPDYYATVQYVLADLARDGLLPKGLRVLDVGAGVGGPALGLADFLPDDALCEYHAVEPSAAADILDALLDDTDKNFHPTVHRTSAEGFDPDGEYDLILMANVLSEIDDPTTVARQYVDALAPDGSLVAIAPADRETSIGLRGIERALADGGERAGGLRTTEDEWSESSGSERASSARSSSVERSESDGSPATAYAPTVRLWPGHAPTDRGWSFDVKGDLDVPPFQRRLAETADEGAAFVNVDVQYSYSILRRDGARRIEFTPDPNRVAKMADSERHVSSRVDCIAAKLSHSLSDGNPLFKISDGSEAVDHYAVLTRETTLNRALSDADYGALLEFENVLVLWNDDEGSYNLVVDDETIVDRIPV
ncbi:class I SAM-dependent methyltransferase [Halococcus dombrowskii]|uniref:Class I SAM-dependent methyltransferase n=1 Tax=Halococcus dombrowskii TaxID=179637 RepID=A0AAV3SJ26_HALDO|nr:class I SAM-dependent methyltransferase [Halococcus dombrowskii]UOO95918.1 class I SAM-dependent methyltransferase [Halococcus dombrowskii]